MAHTRKTLALNDKWDLDLAGAGLAVKHGAEATAQAVANECRLFTNDAYFIQDRGIPYFSIALGAEYSQEVFRAYLRRAALLVDDVLKILDIEIEDIDPVTRVVRGRIAFKTVGDTPNVTNWTDI